MHPPEAARRAARRAREALRDPVQVNHVDVLAIDLATNLREPRPRPGQTIRVFEDMNDPALRDFLPDSRADLLPVRAARGDTCMVVFVEAEPAGWLFLARATHRDEWSGLRARLAADEIYCYDLWMKSEYRRTGAAVYLARFMLRWVAYKPGLARLYCWVDRENRPSQKLCRGLGLSDCQRVSYARVLGRLGVPVPFSDRPRFGPFSRRGRHA